jgi:hypothetical protein
MPVTIGALFRCIVKDLQTQDNDPDNYLNNPKSDINNPNYDINNPNSAINCRYSSINDASNNEKTRTYEGMFLENLSKCICPIICLKNKQRNLSKSISHNSQTFRRSI